MQYIVLPIIGGFIATIGITTVLWLIDKSGWTRADMVRAVGSFFTKSYENSLKIGLAVHFAAGILISGVYLHILSLLQLNNAVLLTGMGGLLGFVHGFIVSFGIVIFAEHHPVKQFKEADFQVALAHLLGHIVYGLILGLFFAVLQKLGVDLSPAF
ncbi:MAG: hypothetical protein D6748_02530 [Calditrichaeota bacterium]|nr:MAG: hypothetical protein D6748_02530 [Calditrichota bacterium]